MQSQLAHVLSNLISSCDEECEVRDDYSGRAMYGKETSGIVVDDAETVIVLLLQAIHNDDQEFLDQIKQADIPNKLRQDSMGRSIILY